MAKQSLDAFLLDVALQTAKSRNDFWVKARHGPHGRSKYQAGGKQRLKEIAVEFAMAIANAVDTKNWDVAAKAVAPMAVELSRSVFAGDGAVTARETLLVVLYEAGLHDVLKRVAAREEELQEAIESECEEEVVQILLGEKPAILQRLRRRVVICFRRALTFFRRKGTGRPGQGDSPSVE